jgi:hypothetical protein
MHPTYRRHNPYQDGSMSSEDEAGGIDTASDGVTETDDDEGVEGHQELKANWYAC